MSLPARRRLLNWCSSVAVPKGTQRRTTRWPSMSRYSVTSKRAHPILYDAVLFVALLATALALAGASAHAFELPNKIDLPRDEYFIVQNIYRGWWQFAYVLAAQLMAIVALIMLARQQPGVVWPASGSSGMPCSSPGSVLDLHLPGKRRDRELDNNPGELGDASQSMGVLARCGRRLPIYRHGLPHHCGASPRSVSSRLTTPAPARPA